MVEAERRDDAPTAERSSFAWSVGIAAIVGLAVRLTYTLAFEWDRDLRYDAPVYVSRSRFLLEGRGFTNPDEFFFAKVRAEGAIHPPGNVGFLALGDLLGFDAPHGARIWGCLLGTATIVVIGLLGREAFSARVGVVAAAIAAIHPALWARDPSLMAESPAQFLTAVLLLLAFRFWRQPSPSRAAWLGGVVAVAALTRSELLVLAGALVVPVCIAARGTNRQALIRTASAMLWMVAVLAPWVGWNMARFEEPATIATGLDTSLRYGNCEATWYGPEFASSNTFCGIDIEYDPKNERLDESQMGHLYRARAGTYARDHLGRWPVVVAARTGRTLGVYATVREIRSEGVVEGPVLAAALIGSGILAGFGAAAVVWPGPYSRRRLLVLLTPLAAGLAGAAVTFASTRYRAPGEVGLIVLGSVGIVLVADRWRRLSAPRPAPRHAAPD